MRRLASLGSLARTEKFSIVQRWLCSSLAYPIDVVTAICLGGYEMAYSADAKTFTGQYGYAKDMLPSKQPGGCVSGTTLAARPPTHPGRLAPGQETH